MTLEKIQAHSPEAQSADLMAQNIAKLKALFPDLLTETAQGAAINVDVLKALVGDATANDADEKYGLNWHGKRRARQIALTPSTGTLRPCPQESVDWDSTQNLMIEGDNLEVLKLLQKSYAGKVKLIYIDPPYNTGKDFVYPDNFQDNIKNYLELTGQVEGDAKITSNIDVGGRFHTDWLNMMYPRMKLARNLLREDGVIIISIDDGECDNLKKICDEIFGYENYIGTFVINSTPNARDYGHIGKMHDYAHFYAKNISLTQTNELEVPDKTFRFSDEIGGFNVHPLYNSNEAFTPKNRPNLYFKIYLYPNNQIQDKFFEIGFESTPSAIEIFPPESERNNVQFVWRWGKEKCSQNFNKEIIGYKTEGGEFRVVQKMRHTTKLIRSIQDTTAFSTRRGTAEVEELLGGKVASFPKPVDLIRSFIQSGSSNDGIVLDFFAGSGTTGHAVIAQNSADGGCRRYILVQLPEPLDSSNKDQKTAADYCDQLGKPRTIAELTKERLRRAAVKIKAAQQAAAPETGQLNFDDAPSAPAAPLDLGFRVFKLATSNIRPWNPDRSDLAASVQQHVDHILFDRNDQDVLYELLLKLGLDLCVPIEQRQIAGKTVHSIGAGALMACLDAHIAVADAEALALGLAAWRAEQGTAGETTAIFRDSAFENDVAKSNLAAILEQHGVAKVRSL